MKLCPRCGAPNHDQAINCHYCSIQFPPPQQPPPPANWNQSPPVHHTVNNYYINQSKSTKTARKSAPKKKNNIVWKILGWLFVFPLMITLIARKKKTRAWNIAAAISWIVYLVVFGPWNSDSSSKQSTIKNAASISQEQLIETMMVQMALSWTPTVTMTSLPTATPEPTATPQPTMTATLIPTVPPLPTSPPAAVAPAIKNAAPVSETSNCHPNYPDVCIPKDQGDIDCGDIPYKNFRWINSDPYVLDGNKDGICCQG